MELAVLTPPNVPIFIVMTLYSDRRKYHIYSLEGFLYI